ITIGSPERFISTRRGRVTGWRSWGGASGTRGSVLMCFSSGLCRDRGGVGVHPEDPVVLVDVDDAWLVGRKLGLGVAAVGNDDHAVARLHQAGGGAVYAHLAGAVSTLDHVRLEAA